MYMYIHIYIEREGERCAPHPHSAMRILRPKSACFIFGGGVGGDLLQGRGAVGWSSGRKSDCKHRVVSKQFRFWKVYETKKKYHCILFVGRCYGPSERFVPKYFPLSSRRFRNNIPVRRSDFNNKKKYKKIY